MEQKTMRLFTYRKVLSKTLELHHEIPIPVKHKKTGFLKHLKSFRNPACMRVTGLEQIPDTANAQKKGVSGTSSAVVLNLFSK